MSREYENSAAVMQKVLDILSSRGISRMRFAEMLSLSPAVLTYYAQGKRRLSIERIHEFADALGVPAASLIPTEKEGSG